MEQWNQLTSDFRHRNEFNSSTATRTSFSSNHNSCLFSAVSSLATLTASKAALKTVKKKKNCDYHSERFDNTSISKMCGKQLSFFQAPQGEI